MLNQRLKTIWAAAILSGACLLLGFISWFMVRDVEMLLFHIALSVFVFLFFLLVPFFGQLARKTITMLNQRRRLLTGIVLFFVATRLLMPCPLKGSWVGKITGHMCEDHAFLHFAGGSVKNYHGNLKPTHEGTYEKIGWNTYLWKLYPEDKHPSIIHAGWFFFSLEGKKYGNRYWCHRDFNFIENYRTKQAPKIESDTSTKTRTAAE